MNEDLAIADELLTSTDGIIVGGSGDDSLLGDGEDNELIGRGGDDTLDGALGNDLLRGGAGDDSLLGNGGNDILRGAIDNDTLDGGSGNDSLIGGAGDDSLVGSFDDDTLRGNDGNDTLEDGFGRNLLTGGNGNDFIVGGGSNDILNGGAGNDTLDGRFFSDVFTGGAGADTFVVTSDGDFLEITDFEDGVDLIQLPDGVSFSDLNIDNDNGSVVFSFSGEPGEDINFSGGAVGLNSITDINQITAADFAPPPEPEPEEGPSDGDDSLVGTDGDDNIASFAGNDTIDGLEGDDALDGGDGQDILSGGAGNDTIGGGGTDNASDSLSGGEGQDTFILYDDDTLDIITDFDFVNGGDRIVLPQGVAIDDVITRGGGGQSIGLMLGISTPTDDGSSNETFFASFENEPGAVGTTGDKSTAEVVLESLVTSREFAGLPPTEPEPDEIIGTEGDDSLVGTDSDDVINGLAGNDTLDSGAGNDTLDGGAGNDTVDGGAGNDTVDGGTGANDLIGRSGNDTFVLSQDGVGDTIFDFIPGEDTIVLPDGLSRGDVEVSPSELAPSLFDAAISVTATGERLVFLEATGNFTRENIGNSIVGSTGGEIPPEEPQLSGTDGDDSLVGTDSDDVINGLAGNDTLDGGAGNDTIDGGENQDILRGGTGDDLIVGGDSNDAIGGGAGNDTIDGGAFSDNISGGEGQDTFILSPGGSDTITDFNFSGGERLVLPTGATIDDVVVVEGDRDTLRTLGVASNTEGESETLVVFDGGTGFVLDRSVTEILIDSSITLEEFQANG